uniref:Dual specificity phosphatase 2 n=1 Tax=Canis lupus familiaris TaxID=9615 RepID=A0A8C0QJ32_CANLF
MGMCRGEPRSQGLSGGSRSEGGSVLRGGGAKVGGAGAPLTLAKPLPPERVRAPPPRAPPPSARPGPGPPSSRQLEAAGAGAGAFLRCPCMVTRRPAHGYLSRGAARGPRTLGSGQRGRRDSRERAGTKTRSDGGRGSRGGRHGAGGGARAGLRGAGRAAAGAAGGRAHAAARLPPLPGLLPPPRAPRAARALERAAAAPRAGPPRRRPRLPAARPRAPGAPGPRGAGPGRGAGRGQCLGGRAPARRPRARAARRAAAGDPRRAHAVCFLRGGFDGFQACCPDLCSESPAPAMSSAGVENSRSDARAPSYDQGGPVEILPYLFLGSCSHSSDLQGLQACGITAVLNVSASCPNHFEGLFRYKSIPVEDNQMVEISAWFQEAISFIDSVKNSGGRVLVHCQAGISRSATICLAYLIQSRRVRLDEAFDFVKQRRGVISPNFSFMGQLLQFETQVLCH